MAQPSLPFSRYEFLIAWRYLRARRAEGGVSVMTWISLVGIALAVAALIITLAVRAGFRAEFVDTILGANAHVTVYAEGQVNEAGFVDRTLHDYDAMAEKLRSVQGVTRAAPLVKGIVLASSGQANTGVEVYGMAAEDVAAIPRIANPETALGDLGRYGEGLAIGSGVARALEVAVGDRIKILSPKGVATVAGITAPREKDFEVVYIFTAGRFDIDKVRVYMPFSEAQAFFNREGRADEIEVMVTDPDHVEALLPSIGQAAGDTALLWTWRQSSGAFLNALAVEDTVMFVLMSVLVLIASMNIVSGLVMLVKNKGRDIGILRTMGLTEGSVLRVFFLCGAFTGIIGTAAGVVIGCLFAAYFDQILALVNGAAGGGVWDASVRGIYRLPARLDLLDVVKAVSLSLILSFGVTIFPARRAARMNPVEALRYE